MSCMWALHTEYEQLKFALVFFFHKVSLSFQEWARNRESVYFLQLPVMKAVVAIKRMTDNSHLLKKTHDGWSRTEACSRWTAPPQALSNLLTCTLASGASMFLASTALCRESQRDQ